MQGTAAGGRSSDTHEHVWGDTDGRREAAAGDYL